MSGVGLLVKTFTPRRRKRDKRPEPVETRPPDLVAACVDDPITPPPAFLPPGHSKELKKDKNDGGTGESNGNCRGGEDAPPPPPPNVKPERPSSFGPSKLTRRLLCYHNDLYSSPTLPSNLPPHPGCNEGSPRLESPPPPPGDHGMVLSELPEPPIPVSEIGPIPPPPMFSNLAQPPSDLPEYPYGARMISIYSTQIDLTAAIAYCIGTGVIGMSLFNILEALKTENYASVILFSTLVVVETLVMYVMSALGEALADESVRLRDQVYFTKWHNLDDKNRKILLIFSSAMTEPVVISGMGLINLSLETFSSIMNTAYSFFNLMNTQM